MDNVYFQILITTMVGIVIYFVREVFITNKTNTKKLSEIITTLAVKDKDCTKTHESVESKFNSLKESVETKIQDVKEHFSERYEETLALVNNHKH
jgi:hypothetical protein